MHVILCQAAKQLLKQRQTNSSELANTSQASGESKTNKSKQVQASTPVLVDPLNDQPEVNTLLHTPLQILFHYHEFTLGKHKVS